MSGWTRSVIRRVSGAPMAFAVRMGGRGLAFVMTLFLTRVLGIDEYGIFAFAVAWATVLFVVADLGFNGVSVKYVSEYVALRQPDHIRGLLRYAYRLILPVTLVLSAGSALIAALFVDPLFLIGIFLILPTIPMRGISFLWVGVLQGLRHPELSFLPLFIILPISMMTIVGGLDLAGVQVNAELAIGAYVLTGIFVMTAAWGLGWHYLRPIVIDAAIQLEQRRWMRIVVPFTVVPFLTAISTQIGMLVLGVYGSPAEVGYLNVALRLGEPVLIALFAVEATVAPKIAASYRTGELGEMGAVIHSAARSAFLWSLPIGVIFIFFHDWLMGLFGPGFSAGGTTMVVVVGASMFSAVVGISSVCLMMTGNVGMVIRARSVSLLVNVAVCLALVPAMGAVGAALGLAADLLVCYAILTLVVWRRLRVNSTALSLSRVR